jgi:hypothetical protein
MKRIGRFLTIAAAAFAAGAFTSPPAAAQPYCAYYNNGTQSCGIPTLESCDQSLSGVGGYCGPDQQAAIPDNLMQRWRANPDRPHLFAPEPPPGMPGGQEDLPPPPME